MCITLNQIKSCSAWFLRTTRQHLAYSETKQKHVLHSLWLNRSKMQQKEGRVRHWTSKSSNQRWRCRQAAAAKPKTEEKKQQICTVREIYFRLRTAAWLLLLMLMFLVIIRYCALWLNNRCINGTWAGSMITSHITMCIVNVCSAYVCQSFCFCGFLMLFVVSNKPTNPMSQRFWFQFC